MDNLPITIPLPTSFLDEETRCGHFISRKMKRLWAVEIDILFQIKAICDRHNIKWYADGGTLLGAVRHKGFIPWDDDIDIDMFRDDYDKFIFYAKKELKAPYFLQTNETDSQSMYGHAKVRNSMTTGMQLSEFKKNYRYNQGVFVDIFPMDNINDNIDIAKKDVNDAFADFSEARYRLYDVTGRAFYPFTKDIFYWLIRNLKLYKDKLLYYIHGTAYYQEKYNSFEQKIQLLNALETQHTFVYPTGWRESNYWNKKLFEGDVVMLPFEWFEVPAMPRYKELLDVVFGDWQTFVKGTSIHGDLYFDTEKPYTEYLN